MSISLSGRQKIRFMEDLRAHRDSYALNDAEYADQVLKISLNTFKKCVKPINGADLTLKRRTFVNIFTNAGLDPKNYGLSIGVPSQSSPFGGYQKSDFGFLCGRYLLYRRSFLTAQNITRGVLEISLSRIQECLSFMELFYYTAESGAPQELDYHGDIYMNQERNILSLPSYDHGQVRLTLLQLERLSGGGRIKMRGALLTYGNPKGYWQPTVTCVFAEGPIKDKRAHAKDFCGTVHDDSEGYASLSAELQRVEEHVTVMTPLMWAQNANNSAADRSVVTVKS